MKINFYWHSYKYLPYERILAERELEALFNSVPVPHSDGFTIEVDRQDWQKIAKRVTYFHEAVGDDGKRVIPNQVLLEASANGNSQAQKDISSIPVLTRQSTRYSAHGIHEYKGKFNPQIVRAIGNLLNLSPGNWILDPFCGSGTTLLEALHNGWNAVGLDINPLGVEIAKAKIAAFRISPDRLQMRSADLIEDLSCWANLNFNSSFDNHQMRQIGGEEWENALPNLEYLQSWFVPSVLVQLSAILQSIAKTSDFEMQRIFRIILSNIVRDVSLQEPDDLRIRRRKSPPQNMPAIPLFIDTLQSWVNTFLKSRQHFASIPESIQYVILGDARDAVTYVDSFSGKLKFDAVITSPPYVTALPYIDTQRLSLALLGLISASDIRKTEQKLIGNREITNQQRKIWEAALQGNLYDLPKECWQFCHELLTAVDARKDGFRRQNKPALIYQYFSEMSQVFAQVNRLLRPGARFVLVVGPSRTTLGGHQFVIDTPYWLGSIAERHGFRKIEILKLNTYQRYALHRANSIRTEVMLVLEKVSDAS